MAEDEKSSSSILGLSTEGLAGLTAEELNDNPTAIKMLLHYYRQLVDDNAALKNDNNTLKTYLDAYTNTWIQPRSATVNDSRVLLNTS